MGLGIASELRDQQPAEIVLCTDGQPNTGVGRLDVSSPEDTFYSPLGVRAKSLSTSISSEFTGNSLPISTDAG